MPTTAAIPVAAVVTAAAWALLVTVVDVRTLRVPAPVALAGILPAVLAAAAGPPLAAAVGAAASAALYLVARLVSPASLGGGDLRLAPVCGALSGVGGAGTWCASQLGAFVVTALVGLVVVLARGGSRTTRVPHGPGMVWAATVVLALALAARGG